ncbi:hypothetical protein BJ741DRAFT_679219 [Chytriomyces cf. hyalinus JEL632]|nr:hypothetical protein BJ741DRAFT_679219 [Chytriomyces cf. hyalinus JEL632]
MSTNGWEALDNLTPADKKAIKAHGSAIMKRLLFEYVNVPTVMEPWTENILQKAESLIPQCTQHEKFFLQLKSGNPASSLPYMIAINLFLEHHTRKTLNPTLLCTTYIPGSITLNTAAMVDHVFKGASDFDALRASHGLFPNESGKVNTHLWQFVCKFHTRRNKKQKRKFTNSRAGKSGLHKYSADRHKAGIHHINTGAFGAGWLDMVCVKPSKQFEVEFPYVHTLPKEKKPTDPGNTNLLYRKDLGDSERYRLLFVDPGKKNIVTVGTGRNQDEYKRSISKVVVGDDGQALQFTDQEDVTHDITLETLITMEYVQDYTESNSASNIKSKFKDGDRELVLCWGNWGRHPTIKNQPPTPGVGLRRIMTQDFKTVTVDERRQDSRNPSFAQLQKRIMQQMVAARRAGSRQI